MKLVFTLLLTMLACEGGAWAVEFSEAQIAGKRLTVCRVNVRKERLQLFLRDDSGQPIKRFDRLAALLEARGRKLTFAMNAGMYHGDFSPVGLFVSELRCKDALFLDGTINSLHSTKLKRSDFRMDLGPIIGIAE